MRDREILEYKLRNKVNNIKHKKKFKVHTQEPSQDTQENRQFYFKESHKPSVYYLPANLLKLISRYLPILGTYVLRFFFYPKNIFIDFFYLPPNE